MIVSLFLYAGVVLALLTAEYREDAKAQRFFKPLAALGFILLALSSGALETLYGQLILAGLVICAFGDVFLLARKSQILFIAGMAAFALGHILYCFALRLSPDLFPSLWSLSHWIIWPIIISVCAFFLYIQPKLDLTMQIMVGLYSLIIGMMVVYAVGSGRFITALAGIIFAASDMFVARDRFVKPSPKNALVITPLYFGAQALFALSTQI